MKRTLQLTLALAAFVAGPAEAGSFTLAIGAPVAAQDFRAKNAAFVVRADSCAVVEKVELKATAEGLVNGARKTLPLNLTAVTKPGVYAVSQQWPAEGAWVVSLTGKCQSETAGAIVPIGGKGFVRESIQSLPHAPTEAEVAASLKSLAR